VSQPEESQEKTRKTDDVLLKPILKDLDDLGDPDRPKDRRRPKRHRDRSAEEDDT
jgi:hypothetical protein